MVGVKVDPLIKNDDFLKSIRVIRFCQNVAGACRVSVKGNDVYTRCKVQNLLLACWAGLASYFYYLALTIDLSGTKYRSVVISVCLSATSFFCEVIIIIVSSKDTVYLMKICQNIGIRAPKLKQSNIYKDWMTYVTILAIIQYYVRAFTIIKYFYTDNLLSFAAKYNFNTFVSYLSELDVLMWVKICDYLRSHLRNLNTVLQGKSKNIFTNDFNSQNCVFLFERCTFCFIYVLKLYRWTILFFYVNFLIWAITLFRTVTTAGNNITEWEIITFTLFKKLMFIAAISYTTEMYKKVCDETGQTCYDILDNHDKGGLKEFADEALFLLREMPPTTHIGGLLHLDFKLFFQFVSQLISYTVIILQFSNFKSN